VIIAGALGFHYFEFGKNANVKIKLDAPTSPKLAANTEGFPTWGNAKAPVTILEFSDFQCPFCSRAATTVEEIRKKYGSKIQIVFKHFPLSFHQQARPASEASMCVNEQSPDKFWKFHDITFKNQQQLDAASLEKYAKEAGANVDQFKKCVEEKKYAKAVQDDLEYGEKLGVRSTPTFFINGELIAGAVPFEDFATVIDEALSQ
jgi:protein-disulfide isomerase